MESQQKIQLTGAIRQCLTRACIASGCSSIAFAPPGMQFDRFFLGYMAIADSEDFIKNPLVIHRRVLNTLKATVQYQQGAHRPLNTVWIKTERILDSKEKDKKRLFIRIYM